MGAGGVCEDVKDERHLIQEGNDAWISNTNGSWVCNMSSGAHRWSLHFMMNDCSG